MLIFVGYWSASRREINSFPFALLFDSWPPDQFPPYIWVEIWSGIIHSDAHSKDLIMMQLKSMLVLSRKWLHLFILKRFHDCHRTAYGQFCVPFGIKNKIQCWLISLSYFKVNGQSAGFPLWNQRPCVYDLERIVLHHIYLLKTGYTWMIPLQFSTRIYGGKWSSGQLCSNPINTTSHGTDDTMTSFADLVKATSWLMQSCLPIAGWLSIIQSY